MLAHSQVGGRVNNHPALVLAVLSSAAFMAMDMFIVNVAFPDISRSFPAASLTDMSWVLSAYAIVYAALLVPLGRIADRFGHKGVFLACLAVFVTASGACAAPRGSGG